MRLAEDGGREPPTGHKHDEKRGRGLSHSRGRDCTHDRADEDRDSQDGDEQTVGIDGRAGTRCDDGLPRAIHANHEISLVVTCATCYLKMWSTSHRGRGRSRTLSDAQAEDMAAMAK